MAESIVSLRRVSMTGSITWNSNVDISPEAIEENRAYVFINKESQRIRKESLNALDGKDVLLVFPTNHKKNPTVCILKIPKTESSVRKIFLPKSVANMLVDWKDEQDEMKEILGDEYMDYNLVMASTFLSVFSTKVQVGENRRYFTDDFPEVKKIIEGGVITKFQNAYELSRYVCYVLECMDKNTTKVRNIKQYLLAALFNARKI